MRQIAALCCAGALLASSPAVMAQDAGESLLDTLARAATMDAETQRSGLISFVENQISSPDRQFRLTGIEGALSSEASIGQITISDTQGIWLVIQNAQINWNQAGLLFGRLEVRSLAAESITWFRHPISTEEPALPSPEAGGFSVPEFPVAIILESLSVPSVRFGDDIFGLGSEISVAGSMTLEGGAIDASLDIDRLDGPGGSLGLDLAYANETREIDLNLELIEPQNGIVANLLNIEGRPEIALGLSGSGQVEDLSVGLTFDADGARILTGQGIINQTTEGLAVSAGLNGPLATVLPAAYRDFFGAETTLALDALVRDAGGIALNRFDLSGGQLSLAASGETTSDGFLRELDINGEIGASDGAPVILPVPGAETLIDRARFSVDFGENGSGDWNGALQVLGFSTPEFSAQSLAFNASGVVANLDDPEQRRITFNGDGLVDGISAQSAEISEALGQNIGLGMAGLWQAGEPITLAQLRLVGNAILLEMAGTIGEAGVFDGTTALNTETLAPFSGLVGRPLSGAIALNATGTLSPAIGGFDMTLDGTATDLSVGDDLADGLIAGEAQLSGRVARTDAGLIAENFRLETPEVAVSADGMFASTSADFGLDVTVSDIASLSPDASGRLDISGTAQGSEGVLDLALTAAVPQGTLDGRNLASAQIGFTGTNTDVGLTGSLDGAAMLDGHRITVQSGIDSNSERLVLSNIGFSAPGTTLSGNITRLASGLLDGRIALNAPNIETAAALALVDASGSASADVRFSSSDGTQSAFIEASLDDIVFNDITLDTAYVEGAVVNLFDVPTFNGALEASGAVVGGLDVETLRFNATATGRNTDFSGSARLANATQASLEGSLAPIKDGYRVAVDSFSVAQGQLAARLAAPATLTVAGDEVQFSGVDLAVGTGRISATGTAGQSLDIALTVSALPLDIANTVVSGLGVSGTLNGTAQISGEASDPRASFRIDGAGLNATAIAPYGVAPLTVAVAGSYANQRITLSEASASGSQGLSATARGTIPLAGSGLDITINGSVPLSLANQFVADSGAQVIGTASVNARASGRIDAPQLSGNVSISGAEYIDPALALRLQNIRVEAALSPSVVTINSASANLATGGGISASGTVRLDSNFTSNLQIALNNARYADGNLLVATVNGGLTVTGPLTAGALVAGRIDVDRADITIPEGLGPNSALIAVDHRNTPQHVAQTLARARADERAQGGASVSTPIRLDVTVSAPNQIFLRGMGLDAEVGGNVRLTGDISNIQPVGGFELIRGRLSILGQRIDFDSGTVTLVGDLDPYVDFVARSQGQDIVVFVTVTGQASSPRIAFSSQPMLPEDEVLARLLFNRGVGELSPLQLAQLAAAAAELAGGGGNNSLLGSLREAAGLDDLDIITDADGNAAVRAGSYIDDNIYLGVEAGAGGQSRVTIDLDITDSLRARGSTGTDGNSSVGIFYEQDY